MTTVNCSLSHPIIFIFDFDNKLMNVPEYDSESTVSFNDVCVSVKAISDVDGELEVTLIYDDENKCPELKQVFYGSIQTPNRKISVVTSLNEKLIELNVDSKLSSIKIYVDEFEFPSRIMAVLSKK